MRIGWATPFNERSAISRFSREVTVELARRGLAVEILRTETGEARNSPPLPTQLPVRDAASLSVAVLRREFDLVVVNLGDSYRFHGGAMAILPSIAALILFHDASMAGFSDHWARDAAAKPETLAALVGAATGENRGTGEDQAMQLWKDLEWLGALAGGAVVHGDHYLAPIRAVSPGPVVKIPLAYPDPGPAPQPTERAGGFLVTTIGHINANKQADRVIAALGASPRLVGSARHRLIGPIGENERERLLDLARQARIREPEFTGWVPEERLQALIGEADVICCLRYPILEGGSASLITSLYSGRPVILPAAGAYAEVPDDLVLKVPYGTALPELTQALEAVADDPAGAAARAARAREWAVRTYSAKAYVDALVPHMEACLGAAPAIAAGRGLGRMLAGLGVEATDPAAARIGEVLAGFFSDRSASGALQG